MNSFPSSEKFLFCKDNIESIEWPDLVHDCVSVIVSRFTFLIEDLVISCQITKTFLLELELRQCVSARGPCHFGSQAYFTNSIFGK